jgi:hypothetical protein
MVANARSGSDTLTHADGFVRYICGKLDTALKLLEAERLAIVCSNAKAGQHLEFLSTVTDALADANHVSIIPDVESGQPRLMPLQDDIDRADTFVVICFDQD